MTRKELIDKIDDLIWENITMPHDDSGMYLGLAIDEIADFILQNFKEKD